MKTTRVNPLRLLAPAALVALAFYGVPEVRAETPGSGSQVSFDHTGCEIRVGYRVMNGCNTASTRIYHDDDARAFRGFGTGSAFATLYCSYAYDFANAAFAGAFEPGDQVACADLGYMKGYPSRSACGVETFCAQR